MDPNKALSVGPGKADDSLSHHYAACTESFQLLLVALQAEACRVIQLGYVDSTKINDEYGRLRIWGEQSKANLPPKARGSLDDTLRKDEDVKSMVRAILLRLDAILNQAIKLSEKSVHDEPDQSDFASVSSASESDYSSDEESDRQIHQQPRIRSLFQQATEQVRALLELSTVLRRPSIEGKWIRSVAKGGNGQSAEAQALDNAYTQADLVHIMEKLHSWRGMGKDVRASAVEVEPAAPLDHRGLDSSLHDILWLCQRLAQANSRRRKQLQYWTDHPYGNTSDETGGQKVSVGTQIPALTRQEAAFEAKSQATTLKPPQSGPSTQKASQPSATTKQTFSTAAVSDIHETVTENERPRTVYAPSLGDRGRSNRVPDAPRPATEGAPVTCPFCGMQLDDNVLSKRDAWKRHVYRDLRPYVCTHRECQNPAKMFVSRTDWVYHEVQMHRRQYACRDCDMKFTDKQKMSDHLALSHSDSISKAQIPFLLNLCNRPADEISLAFCPLCTEEMSLVSLQGHIAAHLEDLALFVLPRDEDEKSSVGSELSNRVAGLQSDGQQGGSDPQPDSLSLPDSPVSLGSGQGPIRIPQSHLEFAEAYTKIERGQNSEKLQRLDQLQHLEQTTGAATIAAWVEENKDGNDDEVHFEEDQPVSETDAGFSYGPTDETSGLNEEESAEFFPAYHCPSPDCGYYPRGLRSNWPGMVTQHIEEKHSSMLKCSWCGDRFELRELVTFHQRYSCPRKPADAVSQPAIRGEKRVRIETPEHGEEAPRFFPAGDSSLDPNEGAIFDSPTASIVDPKDAWGETNDESHSQPKEGTDVVDGIWGYLYPQDADHDKPTVVLKTRSTSPYRAETIVALQMLEKPEEKPAVSGLVREEPSTPSSRLAPKKHRNRSSGGYLLGRHAECDVVIEDQTVSNLHCLIYLEHRPNGIVAMVEDMSTNGTFVNEAHIGRSNIRELQDGDEIAIHSSCKYIFRYPKNRKRSGFLEQYTLLEKLGKGHFAEVYLCVEKATGHRYAVKIFSRPDHPEERTRTTTLQQEVAVLMAINHPNVQSIKDVFNETPSIYVVLGLAAEGELFNHIVMKQKLTEEETRTIFIQLFQAVKYLHERNIVHRDIKPENILLLDKQLLVQLADFGLAKFVGEEDFMDTLCGTPSYVAPEMLADSKRRKYTKAVDIWSLGVVLYICLCGFPPFSDELYSQEFPFTLSQQIKTGRFDYPSPYWDSVGDPALDLIDSMLVVDVNKRFTIEQCLSHPWLGHEGLAEIGAVRLRTPARQRTLISTLNTVQPRPAYEPPTEWDIGKEVSRRRERLQQIAEEVESAFELPTQWTSEPLTIEDRNRITAERQRVVNLLAQLTMRQDKWFVLTDDEVLARQFFHARLRITKRYSLDNPDLLYSLWAHCADLQSIKTLFDDINYDLDSSSGRLMAWVLSSEKEWHWVTVSFHTGLPAEQLISRGAVDRLGYGNAITSHTAKANTFQVRGAEVSMAGEVDLTCVASADKLEAYRTVRNVNFNVHNAADPGLFGSDIVFSLSSDWSEADFLNLSNLMSRLPTSKK